MGVAKNVQGSDQSHSFGRWGVTAQFDRWQIGDETWTFVKADPTPTQGKPIGGAVVMQTGPDEFLVAGNDVRIRFALPGAAPGEHWQYLSVEEGSLGPDGTWQARRRWNGDQTDYGLTITNIPAMLRVRLGTWR